MTIRLIATDVDGTLLNSHHEISTRTRAAFAAAKEAGIIVVAASGRQPYSIGAIVRGTALEGPVIGSNGAVAMELATRELLFEETVDVAAQREFYSQMRRHFPSIAAASVRDGGNEYVAELSYQGQEDPGADLALWPVSHRRAPIDEVLELPSVKLVLRDEETDPEELLVVARQLDIEGIHPTTSGAPFLEAGRAGVSKATAISRFASDLGIDASEVAVFGDNTNDVEMLRWAGLGVAMGNGVLGAKEAADRVTATNDDDGVALVIEELLG